MGAFPDTLHRVRRTFDYLLRLGPVPLPGPQPPVPTPCSPAGALRWPQGSGRRGRARAPVLGVAPERRWSLPPHVSGLGAQASWLLPGTAASVGSQGPPSGHLAVAVT